MLAGMCLALAIYHEARGEPLHGQLMVAKVVVNRMASDKWPSDMCTVIKQPRQFSFVRKGKAPKPRDKVAWAMSQALAAEILKDPSILPYTTADHFHTTQVKPVWRKALYRVARVGQHIFYSYDHPTAIQTSLRPETRPKNF